MAAAARRISPCWAGTAVGAATVVALVAGCATGGTVINEVDLKALLHSHGTQSGGGAGSVEIAVSASRADTAEGRFSVVIAEPARVGESWTSAAWSAATVGTLAAGVDPRGLTIEFQPSNTDEGSVDSALLAVGVLAADRAQARLTESATLLGSVLPSGGIANVTGIPATLREASAAGLETVLIPQGQEFAVDPRDGARVDVVAEGAALGLDVVEVSSLREAYERLAATPAPRPGGTAPAIAGELLAATGLWATRVNSRLTDLQVAAAATAATRPDRQRIAAALLAARTRVPELLASGRPIEAYALATATERMALAWNARSEAVRGASTAASAATVTQTLAQASTSVAARAADAVTTGAQTQVTSVEQLAALPVALTWGADAYAEAVDAGDRVDESRQSPMRADVLGEVAADLARAEYDLATYMPDSLTAATMSAGHPTLDASLATLGVYADALAQAGSANLAYLDSMGADDGRTVSPEASIARALADRWPTLPTDSAQGPIVTRLTTALSYFVASATAVARADAPPTSPTNRNAALIDPSAFSTQVAVATDETALTAGTLAGQGVGTSFLQWNDAVGRDLATAPDAASITDPISLDGLQVQWYANVQGKILGVLSADAD